MIFLFDVLNVLHDHVILYSILLTYLIEILFPHSQNKINLLLNLMIHSSNFPLFFVSPTTVSEILKYFTSKRPEDPSSMVFYNYFSHDPIPRIDKQQINLVIERLKNNYSITMALDPISKYFIFMQNRINFYLKEFQTISKSRNTATSLLMHIVISFLSTNDLSTASGSFPNLLDAIILSKDILSRPIYIFSLSSCIAHFIEDNSSPFTTSLLMRSFPCVESDFFDLYTFVLANSLKKSEEESVSYLLKIFKDSILKNPNEFIKCNFTNILSYLSPRILSFDSLTLELIAALSFVRDNDEDIQNCIKAVPLYFSHHYNANFKICEEPVQPFGKPKFFRFSYEFETESYFDNGLKPLPSEIFETVYPTEFNTDSILKSITSFLHGLSKFYFNYFFQEYPVVDDVKYIFFIQLLIEMKNEINITENILQKILNPIVFSPDITLFDFQDAYKTIYSLRKQIFDMIINYHQYIFPIFLSHFDSSPLLFTELIGRLHCNLSLINSSLLTDELTINSIVQIMMFFKEEKSEIYQIARSTFYLFLFSLLKNDNSTRTIFFTSSVFVNGYFTSILEPTLHSSILDSYLNFLQQCTKPDTLRPSIDMICGIFKLCNDVNMAHSILNSFIKTISINKNISKHMTPFINSITAYLHRHPSEKLLNEAIQLYLHCDYQFEMRQIRELSNSIKTVNQNNDPDDELITSLLCLISNSPSASLNSRFLIAHETLLITFFSIFKTPERADPIFDFFNELCHYSQYNCYQCNHAEVDLLLIEMIRNYPNNFAFRGIDMCSCIIKSKERIIDLLCYIASVRSSPAVCLQIISLFQTEGYAFLSKILSAISNQKRNIQAIGTSNSQIFLSKNKIKGKEIDNRFTIQIWVKIDEAICHFTESSISLFKIVDGSMNMNIMINSNGSLIVKMISDYGTSSAMLKNTFSYGNGQYSSFQLITIVFKRNENQNIDGVSSILSCSINGSKYDNFTVKDFPHFSNNYVELSIGNIESINPVKSAFPIFIGDYYFYSRKLKQNEVINYYQKGEIAQDFVFQTLPVSKNIFPNFLDIFISTTVNHFVLPFFYLCGDEVNNMFLETLIDILKAGFNYKDKIDFDFKIYSYALIQSNHITFALYQRFFSLLDFQLSQNTMKSLVYDILLNFNIWCHKKDPVHLQKIVHHWGNSLFNACSTILDNFLIVFSQMSLYFSFSDPSNSEIDLHFCRQNLDKLLLSMSSVSFTTDDAIAILSGCANNDPVQILYDLNLLYRILSVNSESDSSISENSSDLSKHNNSSTRNAFPTSLCKNLFYFLKPQKEKQFIAALKIIYIVSNLKFAKYANLILCMFNEYYVTQELFEEMMNILPDFPMIYPLVIFLSLNLGSKNLDNVVLSLKTLKVPTLATNWMVMPLMLYALTRNVDIIMFCSTNMIANYTYEAFEYTIFFINFLSVVLDINFEDFLLKFVKIVVDYINIENKIELQKIWEICATFLLMNSRPSTSFDSTDIINAPIKFEFNSNIDNFIYILHKDISHAKLYFRVSCSQLLKTVIRLFPKINHEAPLLKVICEFFKNINDQKHMTLDQLNSCNSLFPLFYESECNIFRTKIINLQNKQIEYWTKAKNKIIKYITSFGSQEASIAVSNADFLRNDDKKIELILKKNVLSEFSIWAHKGLYLTQIRRVFQYSSLMNQIRLKKSSNAKKLNNNLLPNAIYNGFYVKQCIIIKISSETPAVFSLEHERFILNTPNSQKIVMLSEIRHILRRYRFQNETSLEFILINGYSFLLDFYPTKANSVLKQFRNLRCENLKSFEFNSPREFFEKNNFTEKWCERQISNFEYLMALNIYGGRTFNDSNLYPIFPWVLTQFNNFDKTSISSSQSTEFKAEQPLSLSENKDDEHRSLRRSSSFENNNKNNQRIFGKPICIQDDNKYDELKLKFLFDQPISHSNCFFLVAPSNTAMVAHWLLRQPPFTQLHCQTEDGRFGFSSRLFQSINRAACQALRGSISWELVPEFYCFPEIFVNLNNYKIGENVNDVFSLESSINFVYFHRQMLESEYVSNNLNEWIDLIFGQNISNVNIGNVYSPLLLSDVWSSPSQREFDHKFIYEILKREIHTRLF